MNNIMMRLLTVIMLMGFSMGAKADVKVLFGEKGTEKFEGTGGTIEVKQEDSKNDKTKVTVTLIVTPADGYKMEKDGIEAYAVISPDGALTRALEISGDALKLDCADYTTDTKKRTYTVDIDSKLALWVKSAAFNKKSDGAKDDPEPTTPVDLGYSGTYYIASGGKGEKNGSATTYTYNSSSPSDNFYLCPTEGWCSYKATDDFEAGNNQPFLTTYKCRDGAYDATKAVWTIEKAPAPNSDYYYIIQKKTGKYLVSNGQIRTTSNPDRIRVHLESIADPTTQGDKVLFDIYIPSGKTYFVIRPKGITDGHDLDHDNVDHTTHRWLSVNYGNYNYLTGRSGKEGGPNDSSVGNYSNVAGIVCIYVENDANAPFYLEDYIIRPTITYNSSNLIEITPAQTGTVTIKYTTDGSIPSTTHGETYLAPFDPEDNVTTIKAIAIVNGELSNVATFTPTVLLGTTHKRLIQSQNNPWNTTEFHFYMIPGDEDANDILKVNTTSLFRPTMEWYFLNAGDDYYYIVNNSAKNNSNNPYYLCYDATNNVYMETYSEDNKFKFSIVESATAGTFNIIPYGLTSGNRFVNKNNGNNKVDNISVVSSGTGENARWKFIASSTLDRTAPFTASVSASNSYSYYKIASVGSSGYYIIPGATNAITSNSSDDEVLKSGIWYFEEAQAANASDWCTYYHIRNAMTGDFLYFTRDANNTGACLATSNEITAGSEDRYMFTWAKTADTNVNYYIIPKLLKDASQNQFSSLRKSDNGTGIYTNLNRGAGNYAWTFESSTFHCTEPEVTYDDANNQIGISSPQGIGVYYTIDGADDNVIPSSSTHYTQPLEIGSTSQIIRAVCARSGDGNDNSDVVKIIFNPTVTLEEESVTLSNASVTYDGSGHQPTISSAEYNSTDLTDECTFAKYLDADGNVVSECVNAGEYNVVITDVDGGDYYVYGSTTFTITQASLTITPDDGQSKGYGDPDPVLTYISSGLLTGDELTGALSRDEGETVGNTYAITQGTLGNDNYEISFTTGKTFEITAKSLGNGSTPAPNITCDVTESGGTYDVLVKQGGDNLTVITDYTKEGESDGDKYYQVTVTGTGNYTDGFSVKLAKIHLSKLTGSSEPGGAALFVSDSGDGNFEVPSDMTAYIVTGISGNTLVLEALDNIPEQVPVLLVSNIDANSFLVQTASSVTNPTGSNMLLEVTSSTPEYVDDDQSEHNESAHFNIATIYLLYNGELVLNADGYLAKGKIYLPKPSGSSRAPSRLLIMWDETTGIENHSQSIMQNVQLNDAWYTLDGRRLSGPPTKKGIYLMERKKVVIK